MAAANVRHQAFQLSLIEVPNSARTMPTTPDTIRRCSRCGTVATTDDVGRTSTAAKGGWLQKEAVICADCKELTRVLSEIEEALVLEQLKPAGGTHGKHDEDITTLREPHSGNDAEVAPGPDQGKESADYMTGLGSLHWEEVPERGNGDAASRRRREKKNATEDYQEKASCANGRANDEGLSDMDSWMNSTHNMDAAFRLQSLLKGARRVVRRFHVPQPGGKWRAALPRVGGAPPVQPPEHEFCARMVNTTGVLFFA